MVKRTPKQGTSAPPTWARRLRHGTRVTSSLAGHQQAGTSGSSSWAGRLRDGTSASTTSARQLRAESSRSNGQQPVAPSSRLRSQDTSGRTKRSTGQQARTPSTRPSSQRKCSEHDRIAAKKAEKASKKALSRHLETDDAKSARRLSDAAHKFRARSEEPSDVTLQRRKDNALRMSQTRAQETVQVTEARRRAARERHATSSHKTEDIGAARRDIPVEAHYLGKMSVQCSSCKALHFEAELPKSKVFNTCCRHGLVELPMFENFSPELYELYTSDTPEAVNFRKNIRQYNNSLAMGSMKASLDIQTKGPFCFRLHGQVYHLIGPLHPSEGQEHIFAQVFILDTEEAAHQLNNKPYNRDCSGELFKKLIEILNKYNPFVKSFKMMHEKEEEEEVKARAQGKEVRSVKMVFREGKQFDPKRYSLPTANEVAVVFAGDEYEIPGRREIIIYQRSTGKLQNLRDTDKETDPLCYPLLFADGRYGWHINRKQKMSKDGKEEKMSTREFYSYYLHVRPQFNPLHHSRKLFQQYCVDVWIKIEQERLNYIRQNQKKLRVESVKGLMDHISGDEGGPCGQRIFLPSSFSGSPRDMIGQYQDALAIVSKYGKPDLFITMTCNPHWVEIEEALTPGQNAIDRPDIVSRVFKLKIDELKKDILGRKIFGDVSAWVYVVEFQKRGLPHIHMLLILKDDWKLRSAEDVDEVITAELPDKEEDPDLYETISTMMIHRPCGTQNPSSPCMINNTCSKHYPKDFRPVTTIGVDGFTSYRRRDDGRTIRFKTPHGGFVDLDNRSVVPYNKYLSRKFKCHINVERCGHVGATKYLWKYVYKGHTRAAVHIYTDKTGTKYEKEDEIDSFADTRYVCAPEALHHIFGFRMSDRSTPVMQLKVHLQNAQGIVYTAGEEKSALERGQLRDTTLTAWFEANRNCAEELANNGMLSDNMVDSRGIPYGDMPEHFQFLNGKWALRKKHTNCIGRLHFVSPRDQERFALRLLLLEVVDATSYEDLRTVGGQEYKTFVEAAKAAGYLTDDSFYEKSLEEAATFHTAPQFRGFFVTLLLFGEVHNAKDLWNKFLIEFCEDFIYQKYPQHMAEILAYNDLIDRMKSIGERLDNWMKLDYDRIVPEDVIDYDCCEQEGAKMRSTLFPEQDLIIQEVLHALQIGGGLIYVDGPGGTGKTYIYTCLINILQGMHKKVAPVAWPGNAAVLLPHGRTVASFFHLNIKDGCKTSTVHLQSQEAKMLANLDVLVWDEAPMSPKNALETVDQLLRDVTGTDKPFGGKVVLLGGDFRQCLPVMEKKGLDEQVANSIKKSKLWPLFKTFRLTNNIRVKDGDEEWKRYLLEIGNGLKGEGPSGIMEVPPELRSQGDLAEEMFGSLLHNGADVSAISQVAILSPTNKGASEMNEKILEMIPGECRVYRSIDDVGDKKDEPSDASNFPTEFLHKMTPSGLPPHKLKLKVGVIVMLIRNLDVRNGLCNGTRLVVEEMKDRVLRCAFISGSRKGQFVLLPRITLTYDTGIPFTLRRRQFPIRLACSMTINKAQGQTFDRIGLMLTDPVFSHGQLYVALSRTRTKDGVRISAPENIMNNIVLKDVL